MDGCDDKSTVPNVQLNTNGRSHFINLILFTSIEKKNRNDKAFAPVNGNSNAKLPLIVEDFRCNVQSQCMYSNLKVFLRPIERRKK